MALLPKPNKYYYVPYITPQKAEETAKTSLFVSPYICIHTYYTWKETRNIAPNNVESMYVLPVSLSRPFVPIEICDKRGRCELDLTYSMYLDIPAAWWYLILLYVLNTLFATTNGGTNKPLKQPYINIH